MSRYTILAAVAVAVLALAVVFAQTRLDAARATVKDELLYLPNEKLLNHFTGGMDSIVADLIWLRCIQYTAAELKGERGFTWLNHMLATCVRLDPYFKDVYRYGGIFLASLRADDDASLRLLEQGCVQQPEAWELPYEIAMVYLLNRKDEPGSRDRARKYLTLSADTGNAPAFVADLVDKLRDTSDVGDTAIEREMWAKLAGSDDQLLRDMAHRELIELDLRDACRVLTERATAYTQRTGAKIESLENCSPLAPSAWCRKTRSVAPSSSIPTGSCAVPPSSTTNCSAAITPSRARLTNTRKQMALGRPTSKPSSAPATSNNYPPTPTPTAPGPTIPPPAM